MSQALHHLTLNTGHTATHHRSDIGQPAVDLLHPVLDAEGGPVPGMAGWHLGCFFPRDAEGRRLDGSAFFQIADEPGLSKVPAVMCIACWREHAAEDAWKQVRQTYGALREPLVAIGMWRAAPMRPPPLPWLAVWLLPSIVFVGVQDMLAFGDLERCVAFALAAP